MGALPSRESQQRGLYSYRHGRQRRTEIILIPLTRTFFPSPDCPLFMNLFHARHRRTAKYYYRATRPTTASKDSDYFCLTSSANSSEEFQTFCQRRQAQEEEVEETAELSARYPGSPFLPPPTDPVAAAPIPTNPCQEHDYAYERYTDTAEGLYQVLISESEVGMSETDADLRERYFQQVQHANAVLGRPTRATRPHGTHPPSMVEAAALERLAQIQHAAGSLSAARYYRGRSRNTLTLQGWGHATAHPCRCRPCRGQRRRFRRRQRMMRRAAATTAPQNGWAGSTHDREAGGHARSASAIAATVRPLRLASGRPRQARRQRRWLEHIIAPTAHYIRPIPCAIAARSDENKTPQTTDGDGGYVDFDGVQVKLLGMFGVIPSTLQARSGLVTGAGLESSCSHPPASRRNGTVDGAPGTRSNSAIPEDLWDREWSAEDASSGEGSVSEACDEWDEMSEDVEEVDGSGMATTVDQHLLKATMFVDKDVGDQILGQVVLLAANMYVRQCIQARIKPRFLPMLPFLLRFPLTNQPMLQFVREFRVRLRTLLDAGTAKSGERPFHYGMSGFSQEVMDEHHNPTKQRDQEEGYLYEDDVPDICSAAELFDFGEAISTSSLGSSLTNPQLHGAAGTSSSSLHRSLQLSRHLTPCAPAAPTAALHRTRLSNTNARGHIPIFLASGHNVHRTALRHPGLNDTGYRLFRPTSPTSAANGTGPLFAHISTGQRRGSLSLDTGGLSASPLMTPSLPTFASGDVSSPRHPAATTSSTAAHNAAAVTARLLRRKGRFRMWVEKGHLCVWASTAYARRACLLLAQQLNTKMDSDAVPGPRQWNYVGLLHGGDRVPPPQHANDVLVVGEDIPESDLWQGDVLRCCTAAERGTWAMPSALNLGTPNDNHKVVTAHAPPTQGSPITASPEIGSNGTVAAHGSELGSTQPASFQTAIPSASAEVPPAAPFLPLQMHATTTGPDPDRRGSITAVTPRFPLAPQGGFWVRGSGGLDDSYTNISEATPQDEKNAMANGAAMDANDPTTPAGAAGVVQATMRAAAAPDRAVGTLNLEEVILSWVKYVTGLTRDAEESDEEWVRDPDGHFVRIDRYVIRRLEHDGVRYFIGVTPRFCCQQNRVARVLNDIDAVMRQDQIEMDAISIPLLTQLRPTLTSKIAPAVFGGADDLPVTSRSGAERDGSGMESTELERSLIFDMS